MRGLLSIIVVFAIVASICVSAQDVGVVPAERNVDTHESPYFNAARVGNVETIKFELDSGHDVNIQNADGWTPLHFAVDAYQPHAVALVNKQISSFLALGRIDIPHLDSTDAATRSQS